MFPTAALVIGALGGYLTGHNIVPGGQDGSAEKSERRMHSSGRVEMSTSAEASRKRAPRSLRSDEIARLPGNNDRIKALLDFYSGLSPAQLEEEARKLEGMPMNERLVASILLFGRWAEKDPTAAMAFSNTMGMSGMMVRPTILQSWASVDPANAAKYYAANPREFAMMGMMGRGRGPMAGQDASSIIASEWAKQDPKAALTWASSLSNDDGQAVKAVVGEVAKTDPKQAAAMLATMAGTDKSDAYSAVAASYGALNFSEAQAWIRTLPADEQAAALASAIGGLSNNDPQAAAKQVALMAAGDEKDGVVSSVVGDLARVDPKAAADFLKQQGSESAQQRAMRELMPAWVGQDASAALSYANSLGAGDIRDSALQSYVWSNNSASPAELVKVAETMTDEGDRNRSIGVAAARWMREDPTAAKAYVEQSTTLSDDAKQHIISGRGGMGGGRRGN